MWYVGMGLGMLDKEGRRSMTTATGKRKFRRETHRPWKQADGGQALMDDMWDWLEVGLMTRGELAAVVNHFQDPPERPRSLRTGVGGGEWAVLN